MMIGNLFKLVWQVIDLILYLAACVSFTYGAFLINQPFGFIVLGIALIVTAWITERIPTKKGSDS